MISVKKTVRVVALSVSAIAVVGAATFTVFQTVRDDSDSTSEQENLMATDMSKDEYVSYASSDIFYGQVVKKVGENTGDQSGELEQQWEVSVQKAFKGAASGTVVVNTVAYKRADGTTWPGEGGVLMVPDKRYVFAGHYDAESQRYEPYGGATGVRPEAGLQATAKHTGASATEQESVDEHWSQAVTNERQGPPDVASPSDDIVDDSVQPTP
ncbi:hypothetical protein [Streptomyces sp. NPDC049813]|uniref:hypothetical protein n=1 Tax=Streptomyces sp. NPDC049813 TaxID=3365597 RepID=UPI00378C99AF